MKPRSNPLMRERVKDPRVDAARIARAEKLTKRERDRLVLQLTRGEDARQALKQFDGSRDIFGFTRGQFSLVDIIVALLEKTGPAELDISTWTAASADLSSLLDLLDSDKLTRLRLLVDDSFQRRQPAVMKYVVEKFTNSAIRITRNHAKFFTVTNDKWKISCKTSMNLNFNPRFEDFDITADKELHKFLRGVFDELWTQKLEVPKSAPHATQLWREQLNGD